MTGEETKRVVYSEGLRQVIAREERDDLGVVSEYLVKEAGFPIHTISFEKSLGNAHTGVTDTEVLQILVDRFENFEKGSCSCMENAMVISLLRSAMVWLEKRDDDRMERGVKGTDQK